MLHLVYGINSLYLFFNVILVPVPLLPTHLFLHLSLLYLLFHHHSVHRQIPLSFILGLNPISFTNPYRPVVSLPRIIFMDYHLDRLF